MIVETNKSYSADNIISAFNKGKLEAYFEFKDEIMFTPKDLEHLDSYSRENFLRELDYLLRRYGVI